MENINLELQSCMQQLKWHLGMEIQIENISLIKRLLTQIKYKAFEISNLRIHENDSDDNADNTNNHSFIEHSHIMV